MAPVTAAGHLSMVIPASPTKCTARLGGKAAVEELGLVEDFAMLP
jgi:hypothetical protein